MKSMTLRVEPITRPKPVRNPAGRDVWCSEQQKRFDMYLRGAMEA